jgi:hypothetical protein
MRCARCDAYQRYRDGMVCKKCGNRFILSPKSQPHLTDRRVRNAVRRVGDDGKRWFTAPQVVADIARRRKLFLGYSSGARRAKYGACIEAVIRLHRVTGRLAGLISEPMLEEGAPAEWPEPDLFDYGAERIIVVDDRVVVDLLVRNWIHVNGRAIVLSADGYPASVVPLARQLVSDRADLPIAVLHGTGTDAQEFVRVTRRLLGVSEAALVRDLGLPPDAPKKLKVLRWARRMGAVPVDCLPHNYLNAGLLSVMLDERTFEGVQTSDNGGDSVALTWMAMQDDFG